MPHPPKRLTETSPALLLGVLLLATSATAAEPQPAPWAELVPTSAKASAAASKPRSAAGGCQPDNFIPGETPLGKLVEKGTESSRYAFGDGVELEVTDGRKSAQKGKLAQVTYAFSCASSEDYVLDVYRDGKRHALYQHVWGQRQHPTKPLAYFAQTERKQGKYTDFTGLLQLDTKRKVALPALGCIRGTQGFFSGERLITYGEAYKGKGNKTDVCVWSLDGKLQFRLLADLYFSAASDYVLTDEIGLLPGQPDVFYSIHKAFVANPAEAEGCELRLQSLKRPELFRRTDVGEKCTAREVGIDTVTLQAP